MPAFLVHISKDDPGECAARLEEQYPLPNHHKLSEDTYLVHDDNLTKDLAEAIGIDGAAGIDSPTGVVFKLNTRGFGGFDDRSVWEWLDLSMSRSRR